MISAAHVSSRNRNVALENIDKKIKKLSSILKEASSSEFDEEIGIAEVPGSLRAFNAWERSGEFIPNAAETLRSDTARTKLVLTFISDLKLYKKNRRKAKVAGVADELKIARVQLAVMEAAFANSFKEIETLRKKLDAANGKSNSLKKEFREVKKELELELKNLRAENQHLTKTLAKITPLRTNR